MGGALRARPDARGLRADRVGRRRDCGCEECFNFAAARHLVYTPELLELLDSLGIDPLLEAEVHHEGRLAPGRHAYTVWFYVVGRDRVAARRAASRARAPVGASREPAGCGVEVGFAGAEGVGAPDAFLRPPRRAARARPGGALGLERDPSRASD